MKTNEIRSSKTDNKLITVFAIIQVVLGIFFGLIIFVSLYAGSRKTALLLEIVAVIIGFLASFRLSVRYTSSWYIWCLLFGIPMLVQGLFGTYALTGSKNAKQDILILVTSGVLVIICCFIGGYLGKLYGIKRSGKQSIDSL